MSGKIIELETGELITPYTSQEPLIKDEDFNQRINLYKIKKLIEDETDELIPSIVYLQDMINNFEVFKASKFATDIISYLPDDKFYDYHLCIQAIYYKKLLKSYYNDKNNIELVYFYENNDTYYVFKQYRYFLPLIHYFNIPCFDQYYIESSRVSNAK